MAASTPTSITWREPLAVLVGGMLGTAFRLTADTLLPHGAAEFPVSTLLVNVIGSFTLAVLVAGLWTRPGTPSWLKAGLGVGTLGSFTTFSAVAVSIVAMTDAGSLGLALAYLAASLIMGFGAAIAGLSLGIRLALRGAALEVDGVDE